MQSIKDVHEGIVLIYYFAYKTSAFLKSRFTQDLFPKVRRGSSKGGDEERTLILTLTCNWQQSYEAGISMLSLQMRKLKPRARLRSMAEWMEPQM